MLKCIAAGQRELGRPVTTWFDVQFLRSLTTKWRMCGEGARVLARWVHWQVQPPRWEMLLVWATRETARLESHHGETQQLALPLSLRAALCGSWGAAFQGVCMDRVRSSSSGRLLRDCSLRFQGQKLSRPSWVIDLFFSPRHMRQQPVLVPLLCWWKTQFQAHILPSIPLFPFPPLCD